MKTRMFGWLVITMLSSALGSSGAPALLSETGSERATTGLGNLIVTQTGATHVVWLDNDPATSSYWAKVSSLDHATGRWSAPLPLAKAFDNHSRPCIAADDQGFLHVIVSGHNTPFQYLKSLKPGDASAWSKPVLFQKGTYPYLLAGSSNTLWLAGRAVPQDGIHLYAKKGDAPWKLVATPFSRAPQFRDYAGYNTMLAWDPVRKRLHVAADVYEGPTALRRGEHQAIVYLATDDEGRTWKRADGTELGTNRVADTVDVLASSNRKRENAKGPPSLRLSGLVLAPDGRPIVLYSSREPDPWRPMLVTPGADGQWQDLGLAGAAAATATGCTISAHAAGLTLTADGRLLASLSIVPIKAAPGQAAEADEAGEAAAGDVARSVLATSADHGKTWAFAPLLPGSLAERPIAPSLERISGAPAVGTTQPPGIVFFTGLSRYRKAGEVIRNTVYFTRLP